MNERRLMSEWNVPLVILLSQLAASMVHADTSLAVSVPPGPMTRPSVIFTQVNANTFDFGEVLADTEFDAPLVLANVSTRSISLDPKIRASCSCTQASLSSTVLPAMGDSRLWVHVKVPSSGGGVRITLVVSVKSDLANPSLFSIVIQGRSVQGFVQIGILSLNGESRQDAIHTECEVEILRRIDEPRESRLVGLQLPKSVFESYVSLVKQTGTTDTYKLAIVYHPKLDSSRLWQRRVLSVLLILEPDKHRELVVPLCITMRGTVQAEPETAYVFRNKLSDEASAQVVMKTRGGEPFDVVDVDSPKSLSVSWKKRNRESIELEIKYKGVTEATTGFLRTTVNVGVIVDGKRESVALPVIIY